MTLIWPWALLGLLAIPVLVWLDRRRRRPLETTWPSLLLWQGVKEIEAPSKRRVELLLLYECAAVALLAVAATGPVLRTAGPAPIVGVLVGGTSGEARREDGTTAREATRAELLRIDPDMKIVNGDAWTAAALRAKGRRVAIGTWKHDVQAGPGYVVVGWAPQGDNVGIDAVEVKGDRIWFALATDGPPRTVRVMAGGRELTVKTGQGIEIDFVEEIRILDPDNYPHDDMVRLARMVLPVHYDRSIKALDAAMRVGWPVRWVEKRDAWLVVEATGGDPAGESVRGADCVPGPLFEGLLFDELVWEDARTRVARYHDGDSYPVGEDRAPALTWRGRAVVAKSVKRSGRTNIPDGAIWWFGLPLDRDWGDSATLVVLVDRIKRAARHNPMLALFPKFVGDATTNWHPGLVWTKGIDRPWDGKTLPEGEGVVERERNLTWMFAAAAAVVLLVYLRAIRPRGAIP